MSRLENQLLEDLYAAYLMARKGKRKGLEVHKFEMREMEELEKLRDDILTRKYQTGVNTAFIIRDPVVREVFAAPFRDRVVHHYLYAKSAGWWDRRLSVDAYSCRVGKGTLYGQRRLMHHIASVTKNYREQAFVAKLDLQGYFMSLEHRRLYARVEWGLEQQFRKKEEEELKRTLKYLWKTVIFDQPAEKVQIKGKREDWRDLPRTKSLFYQPKGRGIAIGNLTSQLLSNIYLDQLDRFVTLNLGYKHYGRYVDDFYIVVPIEKKVQLLRDLKVIEDYIESLGLKLHPKKQYKQIAEKGVPFLGAVVYPRRLIPGKRLRKNCSRALREMAEGRREMESAVSYLGHMEHMNSKKFLEKMFEELGWRWEPEENRFKTPNSKI